jgi:AraC-like DNA-binding protein
VVAHSFAELEISISLWLSGDFWHPIHIVPNISAFESNSGVASRRWAYNFRMFDQVSRCRAALRGEHAGFFDLFVPVRDAAALRGVLVAGPFARSRPTAHEVATRWYDLTGLRGRLSEQSFSEYVSATLATLTLEGRLGHAFERMMMCFARLVSDQGDASPLAKEATTLAQQLRQARAPERMWDAARQVVDDRSAAAWPEYARTILYSLGLEQAPEHVLVALLSRGGTDSDPLDDLLGRAHFQRECVEVARKAGAAVSGKVGDHGVVFLLGEPMRGARARSRLADVMGRASAIARQLGFDMHAGMSHAVDAASVPRAYRSALWAAEKAMAQRVRLLKGATNYEPSAGHVQELQDELEKCVLESPAMLQSRYDRFVEAVLAHSGHRLELARAQLEVGIERLAKPMLAAGMADRKTLAELRSSMATIAARSRTTGELVPEYRRIVSGLEAAMCRPVAERQTRSIARSVTYVREHLGEPMSLARGAKIAGLAPTHFARLFKRHEGVPFARYVRTMRIKRAKQMLRGSVLSVDQVQRLTGFSSRTTFYRLFKKEVGSTPAEYRAIKLPD